VTLTAEEVAALDPYQLMGVLGKRVIHPGGRRSTEELFELARIEPGHKVLEVGCGVGTTAILIAQRFGATVSAVDLDERMVQATQGNVAAAGLSDSIEVAHADIQGLPFADAQFDRVVIEAVTMFVDRKRAAGECVRVCAPAVESSITNSSGGNLPRQRRAACSSARSARESTSIRRATGGSSTRRPDCGMSSSSRGRSA
jgi:ubiquinone/menaquinone biosynthesis C-methylase UbiE